MKDAIFNIMLIISSKKDTELIRLEIERELIEIYYQGCHDTLQSLRS